MEGVPEHCLPGLLEAVGEEVRVAYGMLDGAGVLAIVGELVAARVAQHVGMGGNLKPRRLATAVTALHTGSA
jgi:hypothetical protein